MGGKNILYLVPRKRAVAGKALLSDRKDRTAMSTRALVRLLLVALFSLALVAGVSFASGTAYASHIPHISLHPSEVELNSAGCVTFTVKGSNYLPNNAIHVHVQDDTIYPAMSDNTGRFTLTVQTCALKKGKHTVSGHELSDNADAVAILTVEK
jgi:hypothetical protein